MPWPADDDDGLNQERLLMRAVLQRVTRAAVKVDGSVVGAINQGWLVLLGVAKVDLVEDADRLADKVVRLRAFADEAGKMNLDVTDVGGSVLVVSQFTLMADCRKGRRPGFDAAAAPTEAERLYERFAGRVEASGIRVARGIFGAHMDVELSNDGPVTFLLESRKAF